MAFYYKPPKGILSFSKLEYGAKTRVQFLLGVYNCNGNMVLMKDLVEQTCTVEDSEWFIEGGKKDRISHYFCRLASSQIPEMSQFFVHAETSLFRYRVTCMREEELVQTVKQIEKFYKLMAEETRLNEYLQQSFTTITALTKNHNFVDLVKEYFKGSKFILSVPFLSVISLVKHRKVPLQRGLALVPVTSLVEILVPMFKDILQYGMKLAMEKYQEVREDPRIRQLCLQLKAIFLGRFPSLTSISSKYHLRCDDIDNASRAFPQCMSLLHQTLRKKHRLSHSARVQYTLFLKECGLPVNEAILFWQREYSQPAQNSTCTHRWNKDGRRYIYSIRHLYGLEGSRTNYRGHSCRAIQDFHISSSQEGGCPFKHMDIDSLAGQLLKEDLSVSFQRQVMEKASAGEYKVACQLYLCGKTAAFHDIEDSVPSEHLMCGVKRIKTECVCKEKTQDGSSKLAEESPRHLDTKTVDTSIGLKDIGAKICDYRTQRKSMKLEMVASNNDTSMEDTSEAISSEQFVCTRDSIKTEIVCNDIRIKTEGKYSTHAEDSVCSCMDMKIAIQNTTSGSEKLDYKIQSKRTNLEDCRTNDKRSVTFCSGIKESEKQKVSRCDSKAQEKVISRKRSRSSRDQCNTQSIQSFTQLPQKTIRAPVDYYESYRQMVEGLR